MESNQSPNNKSKNTASSTSSGIGIGLAAFFISFSLLYILAMIIIRLLGVGGDAGIMLFVFVLPTIISSVIAVTAGIVAGGKSHKSIINENRLESPSEQAPLTEHISKEDFSKLTYRQKFVVTEYGYLLSPKNSEEVGKMLGNFQEKSVLPFCRKNGIEVTFER
jgi:hypothetical protein